MNDAEPDFHELLNALTARMDRQYTAIRTIEGMVASQNIVIGSLVEHHEDLVSLGADAAALSAEHLAILRKQVEATTEGLAAVVTTLKPDHDAMASRKLDGMVASALSKLRP